MMNFLFIGWEYIIEPLASDLFLDIHFWMLVKGHHHAMNA